MEHGAPRIALRPFRVSDAGTVVAWFRTPEDALAVAGTGAPWPYRAADFVAASAGNDRHPLTVTPVDDPDDVVGHVAVVRVTATTGRLARIVLAPRLRGRGLSGELLALAVGEAQMLGLTELALFVVPGNTPALRAYAAAGFVRGEADPENPEYVRLVGSWPSG